MKNNSLLIRILNELIGYMDEDDIVRTKILNEIENFCSNPTNGNNLTSEIFFSNIILEISQSRQDIMSLYLRNSVKNLIIENGGSWSLSEYENKRKGLFDNAMEEALKIAFKDKQPDSEPDSKLNNYIRKFSYGGNINRSEMEELVNYAENVIKEKFYNQYNELKTRNSLIDILNQTVEEALLRIQNKVKLNIHNLTYLRDFKLPQFDYLLKKYKLQSPEEFKKTIQNPFPQEEIKIMNKYWKSVEKSLTNEFLINIENWYPFTKYKPKVIFRQKISDCFKRIYKSQNKKIFYGVAVVTETNDDKVNKLNQFRETLEPNEKEIFDRLLKNPNPIEIANQKGISNDDMDKFIKELKNNIQINAITKQQTIFPQKSSKKIPAQTDTSNTIFGYKKSKNYSAIMLLNIFTNSTTVKDIESTERIPRKTLYRLLKKEENQQSWLVPQTEKHIIINNTVGTNLIKQAKYLINRNKIEDIKNQWREKNNQNYNKWIDFIIKIKNLQKKSTARWWMYNLKKHFNLPINYFRDTQPTEEKVNILFQTYKNKKK
jgi:hypothetical protein